LPFALKGKGKGLGEAVPLLILSSPRSGKRGMGAAAGGGRECCNI